MFSKLVYIKIRYYKNSKEIHAWQVKLIRFYNRKKLIKYIKEEFEVKDLMIDDIKII